MYTHNVTFTKHFVNGTLAGLTYNESVPCVDDRLFRGLVEDEATGRVIVPCAGSCSYTVSNVRITTR